MKKYFSIVFRLALLFWAVSLCAQGEHSKGIESISKAELQDHIYFLASDYMNGRFGPSPQYEIAAQYAATQFSSAGLKTIDADCKSMEGYFQKVPFLKKILENKSSLILSTKSGEQEYLHNEDYKVWFTGDLTEVPMEVIFAGYGIHEPEIGWDDFEGLDPAGKLVIVMSGAPMKQGKPIFPDSIHQKYLSFQGLNTRIMGLRKQNAAAIIFAFDSTLKAECSFSEEFSYLRDTLYQSIGGSANMVFPISYFTKDKVIEAIFQDQPSSPALIEEEGLKFYSTFQLKDVQINARFPLKSQSEMHLKNVVGMVQGTDSTLCQEYITVGAHLDHVKLLSGKVANGADDNASGSAGVIEIAEAIAMNPPRRSVVFITYTAEEMGLLGSDFFVNEGPIALDQIKFNVNLDMIGRTAKENKANRAHYVLGPTEFENALVPFISRINANSINWPLVFDFHHPLADRSDHTSYSKHGIPSFFFCSGIHEDLHRPGDDPEKIEYDKVEAISQLAYLITMELANMDAVPSFTEQYP